MKKNLPQCCVARITKYILPLILTSCALQESAPHIDPLGPINPIHSYNPYAPQSPLAAKVVAEWRTELSQPGVLENTQDKPSRNRLVYRLIFLSDYQFSKYESSLMLGKATRDSFVDMSMFGLTTAASLITPGSATQILSAIAGGLGFSRSNIEKNFFQNQATPVLIAKMQALRNAKFNEIVSRLNLPYEQYPTQLAIVDVLDYYNRGTMLGALQAISKDTAVQEIRTAGGQVVPPPPAPPLSVQIGKSPLQEFTGRRSKQKISLSLEPPTPSAEPIIEIPPSLMPRNIALQRAFPITEDDAAAVFKRNNMKIPDGVLPREALAQNILTVAKLPLKAEATALMSLTKYRQGANTEDKIKRLEDAYRQFLPVPEVVTSDLAARNLSLKNAFENLSRDKAKNILLKNHIDFAPDANPRVVLATKLLEATSPTLPIITNDPVGSLVFYRQKARFDEDLTNNLEKAYRQFSLLP